MYKISFQLQQAKLFNKTILQSITIMFTKYQKIDLTVFYLIWLHKIYCFFNKLRTQLKYKIKLFKFDFGFQFY